MRAATLAAGALALAVAVAPAGAAWLELGATFAVWGAGHLELYDVPPASPEAPGGPGRVAGLAPRSRLPTDGGLEPWLVEFRHEDPRAEVAAIAPILADEAGRLLVLAGPIARLRLARLAGDHVRVHPAPVDRVLVRRVARTIAAPLLPPEAAAILDQLDAVRWRSDLERLVGFGTRTSSTTGIWAAAAWSRDALRALSLEAQIVEYSLWGSPAPNVVATLHPGPDRPVVVIGAHLDSINYGSEGFAPGADDNASGSAGVLELARVLSGLPADPGFELRFCLFSGEEQGLYGSRALATAWKQSGELDRVALMINLDMIAFDQGGPLGVTLETEEFARAEVERMAALASEVTTLEAALSFDPWGSDHVPFLRRGVKAILPIEGEYDDNPNDHTGNDLPSTVNPELARQILRLCAAMVLDRIPPAALR